MNRFFCSQRRRVSGLFVCIILLTPMGSSAADASLEQVLESAKQHLRADNAQAAYDVLIVHEPRFTGTDSYDYLLGVAALDSGNNGDAIFSLQRLVVSKPGFAGARMDLARAYYESGDNELARSEFERVLSDNPPPKVRYAAEQYMKGINARAKAYTPSTQWHLDLGAGYDSNPAAATGDDQFLSFVLASRNVEQSSVYGEVAAGAVYSRPLTAELQFSLNGRLSHRSNPSTHFVDPSAAEVGASLAWNRGAHSAGVSIGASTFLLDGNSNKDDYGITGHYSLSFSERWSADVYARAGEMDFDSELDVLDVDQVMAGLGLTYTGESMRISAGFINAEDDAQETTSPFSNESTGFRLSALWVRPGGRTISVEALAMETDYDDPFFGFDREDDIYSIHLSHTWQRFPSPDWNLTFRVGYSEKESSVSLYEFDRVEAGILIRKVID